MQDVELQSKKGGSPKLEESVDMDTDIPSEHQPNDPIEIEEKEEESQKAMQSKNKGKQVGR